MSTRRQTACQPMWLNALPTVVLILSGQAEATNDIPKARANVLFADWSAYPHMQVAGSVDFEQVNASVTRVAVNLAGLNKYSGMLPAKEHGVHVTTLGNIADECSFSSTHYNPNLLAHGDEDSYLRHIGDLGNWQKTNDKINQVKIFYKGRLPLTGPHSIVGRMVAVHKRRDDVGMGIGQEALETGNSGDQIACGVIAKISGFNTTEQEINPRVKYPLNAVAHMFNNDEYMGNVTLIQESLVGKPILKINVHGFKSMPEYRYLAIFETGKISWTKSCSQLGDEVYGEKGALAKLNIYGNAIKGTFRGNYEIDWFGPNSVVGLGLGFSTKPSPSSGHNADSCGVIGINSDFSPSSAQQLLCSLHLVFLMFTTAVVMRIET